MHTTERGVRARGDPAGLTASRVELCSYCGIGTSLLHDPVGHIFFALLFALRCPDATAAAASGIVNLKLSAA
jgi:hypothetical protein